MFEEQKLKPLRTRLNPITLYHGSPEPNILQFGIIPGKARSRTDYGLGIYFTTNREQAKKWSVRGSGVNHGYVYETHLDYRMILNGTFKLKEFLEYSDEFIDTFTFCRSKGFNPSNISGYDIIYGLMIDSNKETINHVCDDYSLGKVSRGYVKQKLKTLEMSDQICIKNPNLLNLLQISRVDETYVIKGRSKSEERNILWKK